jgi:phosphopantothenoylcysteine decarboxylase/phosphopantothenate--cysteine ligase
VRFLSNYSTGTVGKYLIAAAASRGHKVTWVECPKDAETAGELQTKLSFLVPRHDVLIMAAAVCDARPTAFSAGKIKKESFSAIRLVRNPDILAGLARKKRKDQIFVGFGLESTKILESGRRKLKKKGLDLIVLQKVTSKTHPFGDKPIEAFVMDNAGRRSHFAAISKRRLAGYLIRRSERLFDKARDLKEGF